MPRGSSTRPQPGQLAPRRGVRDAHRDGHDRVEVRIGRSNQVGARHGWRTRVRPRARPDKRPSASTRRRRRCTPGRQASITLVATPFCRSHSCRGVAAQRVTTGRCRLRMRHASVTSGSKPAQLEARGPYGRCRLSPRERTIEDVGALAQGARAIIQPSEHSQSLESRPATEQRKLSTWRSSARTTSARCAPS